MFNRAPAQIIVQLEMLHESRVTCRSVSIPSDFHVWGKYKYRIGRYISEINIILSLLPRESCDVVIHKYTQYELFTLQRLSMHT